MKKTFLMLCCAGAVFSSMGSDDIPRQFKVWGSKAPFQLSKLNAVMGKVGMESIRIPKGFKEALADTNTIAPKLTEAQKKSRQRLFFFC